MVELLLEKGAQIGVSLHDAAQYGRTRMLDFLLTRGAQIEATDKYGNTPLHLAARNGHTSTVRLLLEKGAPIEARNFENKTPVNLVPWYHPGSAQIIKILHNMDSGGSNRYGQSQLRADRQKETRAVN